MPRLGSAGQGPRIRIGTAYVRSGSLARDNPPMRWQAKAAIQGAISVGPRTSSLNYLLQRHLTRNLPRPIEGFRQHAAEAAVHVDTLSRWSSQPLAEARAYEFGAGWDLVGPLMTYCLGIDSQTLVDIRPNVRLELINHTLGRIRDDREYLEDALGRELRMPGDTPLRSLDQLEPRFGIRYLAPCDARASGLPGDQFDLISSTFTLEHIPARDIAAILPESLRLLAPGGVLSSAIDMKDHYSYFDPAICSYNFLKFSPRRWRLVNPSVHFQNRLRRSDYLELFARAGFSLVDEQTRWAGDEELAQIAKLETAAEFDRYERDDLGALELRIVATSAESERDRAQPS